MLILLKSIYCESFKLNILNCHRVLVCLFNKMCIKLSKVCLFVYSTKYILSCQKMLILLKLN